MDTDAKDVNGGKTKAVGGIDSAKVENRLVNGEEDSESNSLLPPRRGGMSRKSEKTQRKVQWNDRNGNKLTEVMVFDPRKAEADVAKVGIEIGILVVFPLCCTLDCPTQYLKRRGHTCNLLSDASDSDDEDSESCICTIM